MASSRPPTPVPAPPTQHSKNTTQTPGDTATTSPALVTAISGPNAVKTNTVISINPRYNSNSKDEKITQVFSDNGSLRDLSGPVYGGDYDGDEGFLIFNSDFTRTFSEQCIGRPRDMRAVDGMDTPDADTDADADDNFETYTSINANGLQQLIVRPAQAGGSSGFSSVKNITPNADSA